MTKTFSIIFCVLTLNCIIVASCKNSPLLNHKSENDPSLHRNQIKTGSIIFTKLGINAHLEWLVDPKIPNASFKLFFWVKDSSGPFEDPRGNITIRLWMPDMGHGSSPVKISKTNPGEFLVEQVNFIMPGHWEIQIIVNDDAGKLIEQNNVSIDI